MDTQPIDMTQISPNSGTSEQGVEKKREKQWGCLQTIFFLGTGNLCWVTPGKHNWEWSPLKSAAKSLMIAKVFYNNNCFELWTVLWNICAAVREWGMRQNFCNFKRNGFLSCLHGLLVQNLLLFYYKSYGTNYYRKVFFLASACAFSSPKHQQKNSLLGPHLSCLYHGGIVPPASVQLFMSETSVLSLLQKKELKVPMIIPHDIGISAA